MAVAVWLGIYVVSHSPRSAIAWPAGLALWSLAGLFFNYLLGLNPPPSPAMLPLWMRPLLWFWPEGAFENGWGAWLKGWQITPAIIFWHHVTMLMRPGRMGAWRWARVIFGYVVAAVAIIGQRNTSLIFSSDVMQGNPLYLTTLIPGPYYPEYMGFLLLFTILSLINLIRSARSTPTILQRKQLELMAAATVIAGLSGPIAFISYRLNFLLPRVSLTLLLGSAVFMIGYGVARYSALMEGRVIGRDLFYNGVAVLLVAGLYLLVVWSSVTTYGVPVAAIAIVVVLAILTHSLVDVSRRVFDLIFYRREARELRDRLRNLIHQADGGEALDESLSMTLETLCKLVSANYGFIILFKDEENYQAASYRWRHVSINLERQDLESDDAIILPHKKFPPPLDEAALLIPLYAGEKQQGALILGRPENSVSYSESDVRQLLDAGDRIADAIRDAQRESSNLARLAEMAEVPLSQPDLQADLLTKSVEDALRNLFDYAYLADTKLANSPLTDSRLPDGEVTHLERGKAVYKAVLDALEHMRPGSETPRDPPPREWYPYLILRDAYLNGVSNRDIMLKLYISEGTFNRTRRAAIHSLARALSEMEMAVQ
jgi:hypothetical protein